MTIAMMWMTNNHRGNHRRIRVTFILKCLLFLLADVRLRDYVSTGIVTAMPMMRTRHKTTDIKGSLMKWAFVCAQLRRDLWRWFQELLCSRQTNAMSERGMTSVSRMMRTRGLYSAALNIWSRFECQCQREWHHCHMTTMTSAINMKDLGTWKMLKWRVELLHPSMACNKRYTMQSDRVRA